MDISNNKKLKSDNKDAEDFNEMLEEMERKEEIAQSEIDDAVADANIEEIVYMEEPKIEPGIYDDDPSDPEVLEEKALGADDVNESDKEYEKYELEEKPNEEPDYEALIQEGIKLNTKKAESLISSGAYKESLEALDILLQINSDDVDALFQKGFVLDKLGRKHEALDILGKLLKINPNHKKALDLKINLANKQ